MALKKKTFDYVYSQLEQTDGHTVLFGLKGEPSVLFRMENPVQQWCTDSRPYAEFQSLMTNVLQTLGEGYCIQKQDIFSSQTYNHPCDESTPFLSAAYFRYFSGRAYTEISTYLIITQEPRQSTFVQYDPKLWNEFLTKITKICDIFADKGIPFHELDKREVNEYIHRFMAVDFRT